MNLDAVLGLSLGALAGGFVMAGIGGVFWSIPVQLTFAIGSAFGFMGGLIGLAILRYQDARAMEEMDR